MADTRGLGPIYWHTMKYPIKFKGLLDAAETQEIDSPFRRGRGYAIRFPGTCHALVLGRWQSRHSESEALTYAIGGRAMDSEEVDWNHVRGGENDEVES